MSFLSSIWVPPTPESLNNALKQSRRVALHAQEAKLKNVETKQKQELATFLKDIQKRKDKFHDDVKHIQQSSSFEFIHTHIHNLLKTLDHEPPHRKWDSLYEEVQWLLKEKNEVYKTKNKPKGFFSHLRHGVSRLKSGLKQVGAIVRIRDRKSRSLRKKQIANTSSQQKQQIGSDLEIRIQARSQLYREESLRLVAEIERNWHVQIEIEIEQFSRKQHTEAKEFQKRLIEIDQLSDRLVRVLSRYEEERLALQNHQSIIAKSKANSKSKLKQHFPQPFRLGFGQDILDEFPAYAMKTAQKGPSNCNSKTVTLQPYQQVIPRLLRANSPYVGFLAAYEPGTGKTALALQQIRLNIADYKSALILVHTETAFAIWRQEMEKWLSDVFTIKVAYSERNTQVLHLIPRTTTTTTKHHYEIILHKMTVGLPNRVYKKVVKTSKYRLDDTIVSTLPNAVQSVYKTILRNQQQYVLQRKVGSAPHGLIIVDEAHYLVNATEISRSINDSLTVLAWANFLMQNELHRNRMLFLTGTSNDPETPLPFLKLLNFLLPEARRHAGHVAYAGSWKRSLSVEEQKNDSLKQLYSSIDDHEQQHFEHLYLDLDKQQQHKWKPGVEKHFQINYGSTLFYVTLSKDPTVFPTMDSHCQSCSFIWSDSKNRIEELPHSQAEKQFGIADVKDKSIRQLFVPMAKKQYSTMKHAMNDDVKRFHRAFDRLSYGKKELKSSVLQSFGTRSYAGESNPKLNALLFLLNLNHQRHEKTFAFSVTLDQRWVNQVQAFFVKHHYDVLTLGDVVKRQHSNPQWTERLFQTKKRRVFIFVASASINAEFSAEKIFEARNEMLRVWNDTKNLNGEYVCGFIGGRSANTGVSLLHTLNGVLLDVSSSDSMEKQAIARIFRNCGLFQFPMEKWNQMKVWQFVSVSVIGGTTDTLKTNEQYQLRALRERRLTSTSEQVWRAVLPAAADCELMHRYNQVPKQCVSSSLLSKQSKSKKPLEDAYVEWFLSSTNFATEKGIFVVAQNEIFDVKTLRYVASRNMRIIGTFPSMITFVDEWIFNYFTTQATQQKSKRSKRSKRTPIHHFDPSRWGDVLLSLWSTPRTALTRSVVWQAIDDFPHQYQEFLKEFVQGRFAVYNNKKTNTPEEKIEVDIAYESYKTMKRLVSELLKGIRMLDILAS